jgi:hypothetical protein
VNLWLSGSRIWLAKATASFGGAKRATSFSRKASKSPTARRRRQEMVLRQPQVSRLAP